MLPGYNHNVEYQGRTFHVQTEDSGVDKAHIISHLFEGGNILETRKCDYTNIIDSEQRDKVLMSLMLNQHQALIRELENGQLDEALKGSESAEQEPDAIQSESDLSADSASENKEESSTQVEVSESPQEPQPDVPESGEPDWLAKLGPPRVLRRQKSSSAPPPKTEAEIAALAQTTITQIVEGGSGIQLPATSNPQGSLDDAMNVILSAADDDSASN